MKSRQPAVTPSRRIRRGAAVAAARKTEDRAWTARDRIVKTATTSDEWLRLKSQSNRGRNQPEHRPPAATRARDARRSQ